MAKTYFVSGIGTDVGKTVASAILCKALNAAYWKPIQSGNILGTDKETIQQLCGTDQVVFDEVFSLREPLSPHTAARIEGVEVDLDRFQIPQHPGNLIVEGAGGLMVPMTRHVLIGDWIKTSALPVILVSRHYLGSINHTMLSLDYLANQKIPVAGVLFIGKDNDYNEVLICARYKVRNLGNIPEVSQVTSTFVNVYAGELVNNWKKLNFNDLLS